MPAKRGPTSNKRQRERSRQERREKKEQRRLQRQADKKNGVAPEAEAREEELPPAEVVETV